MQRSFQLAGLEVAVDGPDSALASVPDAFPLREHVAAPPGLIVTLDVDPALDDRPHGAGYPAFARRRNGEALEVERADAAGTIEVGGAPIVARFRVSNHPSSIEACLRVALSVALPRHDALILHASATTWRGRAHLFAGVSGAGKSTIAALLSGQPGWARLADDLVVVARGDRGWSAEVPPFLGTTGLPHGESFPLDDLNLLVQAPAHRRRSLSAPAAMRELLRHVVVFAAEESTSEVVLDLVARLVAEVPTYHLEFTPDEAVVQVLDIT